MLENTKLFGLTILALIPWKILYNKYKTNQLKYEKQLLFHERHNCVVMYTNIKGMSGWPPYKDQIVANIKEKNCLDPLYEPIIYFINTADKSLDISYMIIAIQKVYNTIIEACKRGVKIRLLMNFEESKNNLIPVQDCIKEGVSVQLYHNRNQNCVSIMHYKYMVKDYEEGKSGYIVNGSMNLTSNAFLENYENLMFSTDSYLVKSLHDNFEDCWKYIQTENKNF
ncbi:uncharacterized protein LOC130904092 [Diorhabda carinulata]|uniref:uncharacterized protein LOC130904092 n=1 Tax=Diorhabda carinulata TaxID=1163345 RepID=UPI0025A16594|nr:uncharacterized protein LOC130904092 [Diorhabda carinulata]